MQLLFDTVLAGGWLSTLHGPNQPSCAFPPIQRDSGSLPSLAQHYQPRQLARRYYHKCGYRVEEPLSVDEALHAVGAAEEVLAQVVNCNCN